VYDAKEGGCRAVEFLRLVVNGDMNVGTHCARLSSVGLTDRLRCWLCCFRRGVVMFSSYACLQVNWFIPVSDQCLG
jgi:hypothetical protein